MRFWSKVEVLDATADRAMLTVVGPEVPALLERVGLDVPGEPYGVAGGEVLVRRMPWPGIDAADLLVPRSTLATWWDRLTGSGARPMGSWGFEALRVESRRARFGVDTDERTIPHEVGWVGVAAHVAKGCYRGQETVARVHNLGHPPRRLVFLHLDGSVDRLPEHGDAVETTGDGEGQRTTVGFTGSAARHYELGPIGLAQVKRNVPVDAPLLAGGVAAAQEVIVPPDAGAVHRSPA